jgi:hypothetical protein
MKGSDQKNEYFKRFLEKVKININLLISVAK